MMQHLVVLMYIMYVMNIFKNLQTKQINTNLFWDVLYMGFALKTFIIMDVA